jgi:hypothetical protein
MPKILKPKPDPKTIALTPDTLARLGAARLAELVLELSAGDAAFKRRLKIELSGPEGAARAIAGRLATIAKSKSYIDWRKVRVVHSELLDQRAAILEMVAPSDPGVALELMWQFMALASPLLDRTFDMNATLVDLFGDTVPLVGALAIAAKPLPGVLAGQVQEILLGDTSTTYDGLIAALGPALGDDGLVALKTHMLTARDAAPRYGDKTSHARACQRALQHIADAQGDVDAFIESFPSNQRQSPVVSAQIGDRLLKAGRAGEALTFLDASLGTLGKDARLDWAPWEAARADTLEALGQKADAQAFRLACFERSLNGDLLRAYIKRLPDFDDEEALDKSLLYARDFADTTKAITFLMNWPAHKHAATRIIKDAHNLDGNAYEWLTDMATTLSDNHPLAATLVRRAMVEFTLRKSKSKRYRYAARHIKDCATCAVHIDDWYDHPDHANWLAPLIEEFPRKFGVWDLI